MKQKKQDTYTVYNCQNCGTTLSPAETRVFLEGRYAIDPTGDDRQLCLDCKEEYGKKETWT